MSVAGVSQGRYSLANVLVGTSGIVTLTVISYYLNQFFLLLIDVVSSFVVGVAEWNWMYSLDFFSSSDFIEAMHIPLLLCNRQT